MAGSNIFPFALWFDLATRSNQLMQASAEVILRRSYGMARMGMPPSSTERQELQRMVDEKVQASMESAIAMSLRAVRSYQALMVRVMTGRFDMMPLTTLAYTGSQIASAGLTPFHRRARLNVKRLRK